MHQLQGKIQEPEGEVPKTGRKVMGKTRSVIKDGKGQQEGKRTLLKG